MPQTRAPRPPRTEQPGSPIPDSGKPRDVAALTDELTGSFRETAESIVPWFVKNMPLVYFQDTDRVTILSHLRAIIAAKASNRPIELTLRNEDSSQWTLMRPMQYPGVLAEMVAQLPHDPPLRAAKIHTADDGQLVLDTFEFGAAPKFDVNDPEQAAKVEKTIEYAREHAPHIGQDEVRAHFRRCSAEYVATVTPLRLCKHWALFKQVSSTDSTAVELEPEADPTKSRIILAAGNSTTRTMLERIAFRLSHSSINIQRAYLDIIDDPPSGSVSLLGFVVQGPDGSAIDPASENWQRVRKDLIRLKWIDQPTLDLDYRHPDLDLVQAEVIMALCHLVHQVLVKEDSHAFDRERICKLTERELPQSKKIVNLLLERFEPTKPLDDDSFTARTIELRAEIDSEVDLPDARAVLHKLLDAVHAVRRTNVYLQDRYALSMRIDPNFMTTEGRQHVPYGVYFVHGRLLNGFHVRFRDIARGGIRAIRTTSSDQHARELERLYDEAYGLAFAQQLKNKDIPEGGAKAAILLDPQAMVGRGVKAFVDALLDLITPEPATRNLVVDRLGQQELLYFGPDENITPDLIEWVVSRAQRRGYPTPTALMSSKPGAGINHKVYGVTSEGVTVFLDVALRHIGIDPRNQSFTVKITGGPDGDVAGNEIKILNRDYGANARIVGIADGSGVGEDPDGLDHAELLRLVAASLPIAHFDRTRLGKRGRIVALAEPDGVHLRNTLHNRIESDAFIPAGGRPNTIHAGNWKEFLTREKKPSSPLIVEGANLFLTPDARLQLSEVGALIIKDSSANKCGVICSSFEIVASMLLSESEFLSIKERFVGEVIVKLRELARREADLLLRFHRHHPQVPLPEMSERLSRVVIRAADAIEAAIDSLKGDDADLIRTLVVDHLPPILVTTAGERLWTKTPRTYLKWIMAKSLAARIVYREGFESLESMPLGAIAELALRYLKMEVERRKLVEQVRASTLLDRDRIAALLQKAGILSTLGEG